MGLFVRSLALTLAVMVASSAATYEEHLRRKRDTVIDTISPRFDFGLDKGSDKGGGGGGGSYGSGGYSMGGGGYGGGGGGGYGGGGGGGYGGSGGGGYGGGGMGGYGGGGGSYGGGGGYGCMDGGGGKGDKGAELSILGIGIPAALLLLLLPLGLLLLPLLIAALVFFIGRSNNEGLGLLGRIPGLPNLDLLRTVDEAVAAYDALSKDEKCRQKVACQLGYIFKGSEKKSRVLSILDSVLPESIHKHFKPLKKAVETGETGKCDQTYECDARDFEGLFGVANHNKNSTSSS